jgi:hypothetical protein
MGKNWAALAAKAKNRGKIRASPQDQPYSLAAAQSPRMTSPDKTKIRVNLLL